MYLSRHTHKLSAETNDNETNISMNNPEDQKSLSFGPVQTYLNFCKGNVSKPFIDSCLESMDFTKQPG